MSGDRRYQKFFKRCKNFSCCSQYTNFLSVFLAPAICGDDQCPARRFGSSLHDRIGAMEGSKSIDLSAEIPIFSMPANMAVWAVSEVWIGTLGPKSCLKVFQRSIWTQCWGGTQPCNLVLISIGLANPQSERTLGPTTLEAPLCILRCVALRLWHLKCSYFLPMVLGRLVFPGFNGSYGGWNVGSLLHSAIAGLIFFVRSYPRCLHPSVTLP